MRSPPTSSGGAAASGCGTRPASAARSRVTGKIEKLAVSDALRAIRFAECVVVLIDASLPIERQDLTLCDLVAEEGRAVVLALSKWDLVEDKQKTLKEVESELEDVLPEIRGVPVVTLSAKQERGLDKLLERGARRHGALEQPHFHRPAQPLARRRRSNAIRRPHRRAAASRSATPPRPVRGRPPSPSSATSCPRLPESYMRYLMNGLRKDFELWGVPIRFSLRGGKNPFDKDR